MQLRSHLLRNTTQFWSEYEKKVAQLPPRCRWSGIRKTKLKGFQISNPKRAGKRKWTTNPRAKVRLAIQVQNRIVSLRCQIKSNQAGGPVRIKKDKCKSSEHLQVVNRRKLRSELLSTKFFFTEIHDMSSCTNNRILTLPCPSFPENLTRIQF